MHLYVKSVCFAHNVYFLLLYIKNVKLATIIKNVIKAKAELECAINNFEYAENDLIDYFSYQIKPLISP